MARLRTLAILTTLGAGGASALGSGPDDPAPSAPSSAAPAALRKEPPAPPRQYLETGCKLFNAKRYNEAKKYLDAAQMYRDRLQPQEQVVLDVYREEYAKYAFEKAHPTVPEPLAPPSPTPTAIADASRDLSVRTASGSTVRGTLPSNAFPAVPPEVVAGGTLAQPKVSSADGTYSPPSQVSPPRQETSKSASVLRGTFDDKQRGRWLLQQAREQLLREKFDDADKYVAEARALDVRWGWFDETPDRVSQAISKARAKVAKEGAPRDRRSAQAKLREARAALAVNDVERAEQLVQAVSSWGLRYGRSEDTPEKVAMAVAEARQRESIVNTEKLFKTYVDSSVRRSGVPAASQPLGPADPATAGPR